MKKEYLKNPTLKSWLRTIAIATAILMSIVIISIIYLAFYTRHGEHYMLPSLSGMTIEEAKQLTEEMDIRFEVVDSLYIEAMEPGAILDQYPKAGSYIKSGRKVSVTTNTFMPKNVKIPYVAGYSLRQAKNRIVSSGLQIAKLIYVPDIATNNVIREEYQGNTISSNSDLTVPVNSKITLYVGLGADASSLRAPNLIGELLYVAKDRLWEEGLNVEVSEHEKMSSTEAQKAIVYKQYPLPGDHLQHGGVVSIYISSDSTFVSNNVKLSQAKVKKIANLRESLKKAQEAIKDATDEDMIEQQITIDHITNQLDSLR